MHHHDDHHDDRHQDLIYEGSVQGSESLIDEAGSIIKGNDSHLGHPPIRKGLFGKAGRDLFNLFLHALDRSKRVLSKADNNNTADNLGPTFVESASADSGPNGDRGNILYANGNMTGLFHYSIFNVL